VLLYYVGIWRRVGRDPPQRVIVPQYEPPDGVSPAAMRFLRRMSYDDRCFAAAVLSLAVQGALRIEQENSGLLRRARKFTLQRTEAARRQCCPKTSVCCTNACSPRDRASSSTTPTTPCSAPPSSLTCAP